MRPVVLVKWLIMSEVAMSYSKTRLGGDQIEGARKLTPRGKRIVYLVVAAVLAACTAIGIWSAVTSDPLATSANGCVSVNIASATGGQIGHFCGAQAKSLCRQAFAGADQTSLAEQQQCVLAGLTKAKLAAAG
jgi:hypothetical protein